METTLLTVGLACLVGAVAGGGMNLLGIQIPVLSIRRQVLLGLIGLLLTAGSQLERFGVVGKTVARERPAPPDVSAAGQARPDAAAPSGQSAGSGVLVFAVRGAGSWIDVRPQQGGQPLLSRVVSAGDTVSLRLAGPVRVTVGDPGAVAVTLRGRPVALTPVPGKNLARLSLE